MEMTIKEIKIKNGERAKRYREDRVARGMRNSSGYKMLILKNRLRSLGLTNSEISRVIKGI